MPRRTDRAAARQARIAKLKERLPWLTSKQMYDLEHSNGFKALSTCSPEKFKRRLDLVLATFSQPKTVFTVLQYGSIFGRGEGQFERTIEILRGYLTDEQAINRMARQNPLAFTVSPEKLATMLEKYEIGAPSNNTNRSVMIYVQAWLDQLFPFGPRF